MSIGATLTAFWEDRTGRERSVLLAAACLVLLAALYTLLWEPGIAERRSLAATLPRLRAELEDMRMQREEIVALRKDLDAGSRGGDLQNLLRASAARTRFADAVERIDTLANGSVAMQAAPVRFDAWLEWVERLQRELGVRLEACRLAALEQPGLVRAEARFAPREGRR